MEELSKALLKAVQEGNYPLLIVVLALIGVFSYLRFKKGRSVPVSFSKVERQILAKDIGEEVSGKIAVDMEKCPAINKANGVPKNEKETPTPPS